MKETKKTRKDIIWIWEYIREIHKNRFGNAEFIISIRSPFVECCNDNLLSRLLSIITSVRFGSVYVLTVEMRSSKHELKRIFGSRYVLWTNYGPPFLLKHFSAQILFPSSSRTLMLIVPLILSVFITGLYKIKQLSELLPPTYLIANVTDRL